MTTPFDFIPEYIKIIFVLSVTFGFFAVGCLKAHKEHKREIVSSTYDKSSPLLSRLDK